MLKKLIAWCDRHFVEDWRRVWREASSMKLAALVSALAGVVVADPALLIFLYQLGPERPLAVVVAIVFVYAITTYFRLRKDKTRGNFRDE